VPLSELGDPVHGDAPAVRDKPHGQKQEA
jgi:hypothetical protein